MMFFSSPTSTTTSSSAHTSTTTSTSTATTSAAATTNNCPQQRKKSSSPSPSTTNVTISYTSASSTSSTLHHHHNGTTSNSNGAVVGNGKNGYYNGNGHHLSNTYNNYNNGTPNKMKRRSSNHPTATAGGVGSAGVGAFGGYGSRRRLFSAGGSSSSSSNTSSTSISKIVKKLSLPSIFCFAILFMLFGHQHIVSFDSIKYDIERGDNPNKMNPSSLSSTSFAGRGGTTTKSSSSLTTTGGSGGGGSTSISSSTTRARRRKQAKQRRMKNNIDGRAPIKVPKLPILTFHDEHQDADYNSVDDPRISVTTYFENQHEITTNPSSSSQRTRSDTDKNDLLVVDILSVASKTRSQYYKTQRETWGSHDSIRHFIVVTEDDDPEPNCHTDITWEDVMLTSKWCKSKWSDMVKPYKGGYGATWVQQRFSHYYAGIPWLRSKSNPNAWLCAQKRFPTGLSKVLLQIYDTYRDESSPEEESFLTKLPDYLLVVDDDTYYDMDIFHYEMTQTLNNDPNLPYVATGCRVTNGKDQEKGIVFSYGGFGLVFSKGSIERLLRPINCNSWRKKSQYLQQQTLVPISSRIKVWEKDPALATVTTTTDGSGSGSADDFLRNTTTYDHLWEDAACDTVLNAHLIKEYPLFQNGMSTIELMYAVTESQPFSQISNWTTGYCFHGHWVLAYFNQHYRISMPFTLNKRGKRVPVDPTSKYGVLETLQYSEITSFNGKQVTTGLCANGREKELPLCPPQSLVCHYQTPSMMKLIHEHNYTVYDQYMKKLNFEGFDNLDLQRPPLKTLPPPTTASSKSDNGATSAAATATNNDGGGLVIDVISIGSRDRPEYSRSQRNTWANHSSVRNFFIVTEDDDVGLDGGTYDQCVASISDTDVDSIFGYCEKVWSDMSDGNTWLQKRYSHAYNNSVPYSFGTNGESLLTDGNKSSWLCSQKRTPMSLVNVLIQNYSAKSTRESSNSDNVDEVGSDSNTQPEPLPDYLMIVDDGTYYDLDKLLQEGQSSRLPADPTTTPFAGTGCKVVNGKDESRAVTFNHGGYGMLYSRASIRRMLQPIHCRKGFGGADGDNSEFQEWNDVVCGVIRGGLIKETHFFRDGMNLVQLIGAYLTRSIPYQKFKNWNRNEEADVTNSLDNVGYCMHSSWMMSYMVEQYRIGNIPSDKTLATSFGIIDSLSTDGSSEMRIQPKKETPMSVTGLCRNKKWKCTKDSIGCFSQTPESIVSVYNDKLGIPANDSDGVDTQVELKKPTSKFAKPIVSNSGGDGLVHVLKTRFMQHQPDLVKLGYARLDLFETFCLPTIVNQSVGLDKFIWIIRTDPNLEFEILSKLIDMIRMYPNFILIKSNDNTEGLRELKVHDEEFIKSIVVGDVDLLKRYVEQSQSSYVVETRLDADDGLHSNMLELIQYKAKQYQIENQLSILSGGNVISESSDGEEPWRLYCVSRAIEWHTGWLFDHTSSQGNNDHAVPDHGLLVLSRDKMCITPGLSFVLPPNVIRPTSVGHHLLANTYLKCNNDEKQKQCLEFWSKLDFPQAVRARTPTSAGMGGFHKQYQDDPNSSELWKLLQSNYHITQQMAVKTRNMFREQIAGIANDNIKGQCTEDHSCTKFAKRVLDKLAWRADEQAKKASNNTTVVTE